MTRDDSERDVPNSSTGCVHVMLWWQQLPDAPKCPACLGSSLYCSGCDTTGRTAPFEVRYNVTVDADIALDLPNLKALVEERLRNQTSWREFRHTLRTALYRKTDAKVVLEEVQASLFRWWEHDELGAGYNPPIYLKGYCLTGQSPVSAKDRRIASRAVKGMMRRLAEEQRNAAQQRVSRVLYRRAVLTG